VSKCANVRKKKTDWISGIGSVHPDYHGSKNQGRAKWNKEKQNKRRKRSSLCVI